MISCNEFQQYLDDYLDNEISNDLIMQLEEHIRDCKSCQAEFEKAVHIKQSLHNLPQNIPVDSEKIWKGIQSWIHPLLSEKNRMNILRLVIAAIVLIGITFGLFYSKKTTPHKNDLLMMIDQVNRSYATSYAYYEKEFTLRNKDEQIKIIRKNLAIINHSMREIEEVIRQDPSNIAIVKIFLEEHQKRMELLEKMMTNTRFNKEKGEKHEI